MTNVLNVGIIGGTGWMGKAMGEALLRAQFIQPSQLWVSNQSGHNPYQEKIHFEQENQKLCDACDIIILAVLPKQFAHVDATVGENKLVISVMSMISSQQISRQLKTQAVIRSMPNAAIPQGESYIPWFADVGVTATQKSQAKALFTCFGLEDEFASDDEINFMTALTGSSHGWLAYLADALIHIGVGHDLPKKVVERGVRQVMKGVGQLIAQEKHSPHETVKILTDYAGTTAAGLNSFVDSNMDALIAKGILASYRKAKGKP